MSDDDASARAQLALDGELDAASLVAFEREVASSPEAAAEYARLRALRETLRRHAPREAAPEALRAKLEAMAAPAPPARVRRDWRAAGPALAACLALVSALGGYWAGRAGQDAPLDDLVAGYQRAALAGQPFDVASSDRHTVKPWLAARAPLGAFVPDLAASGFPLIGGRIEIVAGRPAPTAVYRREAHIISVSELPLSEARLGATAREGYHIERWTDSERAYVAVSDLDAGELAAFAEAFRKAGGA